jgi:hypothetical protein
MEDFDKLRKSFAKLNTPVNQFTIKSTGVTGPQSEKYK